MYYIRFRAKIFGPFDERQLLNMKSQGKLGRTYEISENKIDWKPALEFTFLFPAPLVPTLSQTSNITTDIQNREDVQNPAGMNILCTNIHYCITHRTTRKQITLLCNISFFIKPRDFVCIIGPSGSGKTTLLNILSGRIKPSGGQVRINGNDLHQNFPILKQRIAVVSQRDILYEPLSAKDSLIYTARLRFPLDISLAKIKQVVALTIQQVGLTEQKSIRVSNLSGGQRKRACLGNEILSQPDIMFLDEVTSGLDEQSDREIMSLIKNISKNGKTAVIVTHSLANVEEFCDKIIVLTKQGRLAFYGTPNAAKNYFNVSKLGEIYDVLGQKTPEMWQDEFYRSDFVQKNIENTQYQSNVLVSELTSNHMTFTEAILMFFHQLFILLIRRVHIQLSDYRSLVGVVAQCLLVAILISLLFGNIENLSNIMEQANASSKIVFLMIISCLWFGCNNTATEIVKERNIYLRERDVSLFPSAYFSSKLLFFSMLGTFQASVLFGIIFFFTKIDISFINAWGMILLLTLVGTAIGLCISVFSKSENFALIMVPIFIIPQIILSGFIYTIEEGLLKYFSVIFISAYWGYIGTINSLVEEQMIEILKPDDWRDYSSILVLTLQSIILICLSLFYLEIEYLFSNKND